MKIKKEIDGILKHSAIYGIGNILHRLPPFILLPIYLNYLSPTDFGKKEIISIVIDFTGIVVSMGIANAMARFYYEYDDKKNQNEVISTIVIAYSFVSAVIFSLLILQADMIAGFIIDNKNEKSIIVMAIISLWFNTIYHMWCNYLRIREKSLIYVVISITKLIVQISLNVIFIVFWGLGINGIFYSTLISSSIFAIFLTFPIFLKIGFKFSYSKIKEIVRLCTKKNIR